MAKYSNSRLRWSVIYPVYLDRNKSRREGRRLPKDTAIRSPTIKEIEKAVQQLGLECRREEKSYPRSWWEQSGRLLVEKKMGKRELLKKIALVISKER
jgi:signal recognition particle subunit SRP19